MIRTPEPCEICGAPIVWAVNREGFEIRLNPGRQTGGYPLTYGTVSHRNYLLDAYRKHALGPLPFGRLVYAQHNCKKSAARTWAGDPILLHGRWPIGMVLPENHPWYDRLGPDDDAIDGDSL